MSTNDFNIQQIAEATINVIGQQPVENLLPTVFDLENHIVRALDGIPNNLSVTQALEDWIKELNLYRFATASIEDGDILLTLVDGGNVSSAILQRENGTWLLQEL